MPIASDALRGYTEAIILRRLMDKDSYGYEINKTIQEKTKGQYELKEATLYTAFEKTGARRRYYAITKEGQAYYKQCLAQWSDTKALIEQLIF